MKWISIIALIAFLPFINRPLFIDDHAIFQQAESLSTRLATPYSTYPEQLGWTPGHDVGEDNPPIFFYLLALLIRTLGPTLWKIHLVLFSIHLLGLWAFYGLAKRFTQYPQWATLCWLFTPHYFVTAQSLLVDSFLIDLFLLAMFCLTQRWMLMGALLLGIVPLIKYTGLLSWPIAGLWILLRKERNSRDWIYFLIPIALFASWMLWSRSIYGHDHFTAVARSRMTWPGLSNYLVLGRFWIGTTPIVLVGLIGLSQIKQINREIVFLASWLVLGLVGLSFALPWVCARFLVIIGPPSVLLSIVIMENVFPKLLDRFTIRFIVLLPIIVLSLLLAQIDYAQARNDVAIAQQANQWLDNHPAIGNYYYPAAALGGLSYYLNKAHWQAIEPAKIVQTGSYVLLPTRTLPSLFWPKLDRAHILERWDYNTWNPLRVLDNPSGAGFYGSIWGALPFSFSKGPVETYLIVRNENDEQTK